MTLCRTDPQVQEKLGWAPPIEVLVNEHEWSLLKTHGGAKVSVLVEVGIRLITLEIENGRKLSDVAEECLVMAQPCGGANGHVQAVAINAMSSPALWPAHGAEFSEWYFVQRRKQRGYRARDCAEAHIHHHSPPPVI